MTVVQNASTTERSIVGAMITVFLFLKMLQSEAIPVEKSRVPRSIWGTLLLPQSTMDTFPIKILRAVSDF